MRPARIAVCPRRELQGGLRRSRSCEVRIPRSPAWGRSDSALWAQEEVAWLPVNERGRGPTDDSYSACEDAKLADLAAEGQREAFEELVRRHADHLYAIVVRYGAEPSEAEEIVQEAFLRAWRGIGGFRGRAKFFTWLYRIGLNEAKRHLARRASRPELVPIDEHAAGLEADPAAGPEPRAEQQDLRSRLEHAIRSLPLDYRAPLILRDVEGLSTEEAATITGLGEAAFKSRLHRARMAMRESMEDYLSEEEGTV